MTDSNYMYGVNLKEYALDVLRNKLSRDSGSQVSYIEDGLRKNLTTG